MNLLKISELKRQVRAITHPPAQDSAVAGKEAGHHIGLPPSGSPGARRVVQDCDNLPNFTQFKKDMMAEMGAPKRSNQTQLNSGRKSREASQEEVDSDGSDSLNADTMMVGVERASRKSKAPQKVETDKA